jgi:hypothetical protein
MRRQSKSEKSIYVNEGPLRNQRPFVFLPRHLLSSDDATLLEILRQQDMCAFAFHNASSYRVYLSDVPNRVQVAERHKHVPAFLFAESPSRNLLVRVDTPEPVVVVDSFV